MKIKKRKSHDSIVKQKTVVIVGGGFGGLRAAKELAQLPDLRILLLDTKNYHLFQPLLYQVATAGLNAADIAVPIRSQFSTNKNVEVHWAKVSEVDLDLNLVRAAEQNLEVEFDYLILACGAQHSYFGKTDWEEHAPGLKTLEQATEIRRKILSAFENAENEYDPVKQRTFLNFVVVGGGPTGVELAGAIADISRTVLIEDFRRIDPSSARIILVEAGSRILASFSEELSAQAKKDLEELGVKVRLGTRVQQITSQGAQVGNEFVPSHCVFWAAGVQASSLLISPVPEYDQVGRIKVTPKLEIPNRNNVFVIGDMASIEVKGGGKVPGLAPAAIQAGRYVAQSIRLLAQENAPQGDFVYFDKGRWLRLESIEPWPKRRGLGSRAISLG